MEAIPVPAAQYLRMSTEHQQYSLQNQADAIAHYATGHDFSIVKTYSDAAKSGLTLRNRPGLKQLLKDVMEGQIDFRAILVYDVSRWGRFQDMDEAAHYEYVCKSAGVPVYYCAEMFSNSNNMSDLIMKALKRTMAGEYSRELSVKVKAGLVRLAKLGYKLGGSAPYGLRRQLLDVGGRPKQVLAFGERKSIANEHVKFVPGPTEEITIVKRIFREFAEEGKNVNSIAARLNEEKVSYLMGRTWKPATIRVLLQDPHYIGMQVWGRTTAFLYGPVKRLPSSEWVVYPSAFEPIISEELFLRAQEVFANFTSRLTNEQLLNRLQRILAVHGKLSAKIIDTSALCPGLSTYNKRFGSLLNIYSRLGYNTPELRSQVSIRQRAMLIRSSLVKSLVGCFPSQMQLIRKNQRFRGLLRYRRTGRLISIVLAKYCGTKDRSSWLVRAPLCERKRTTILVLLDKQNNGVDSIRVVRSIPTKYSHLRVREDSEWLRSGIFLRDVGDFLNVLSELSK